MKKMILSLTLALGLLVVGSQIAIANEGIFKLSGSNNSVCFALSVYKDDRYQVLGTCRNLITPFSAEQTRLIAWRETENKTWKKLTEIEGGKFSAYSNDKFEALKITAEADWNPKKPSETVLVEGGLANLPFESKIEVKETVDITPTPTESRTTKATVKTETPKTSGSLIGAIARAIGTIFLVLVVAGVILTIVTKRKGF